MARVSFCLVAFLFCGSLAGCTSASSGQADTSSKPDVGVDVPMTGGHQETPDSMGTGGTGGSGGATSGGGLAGGSGGATAIGGTLGQGGTLDQGGHSATGGAENQGGSTGAGGVGDTGGVPSQGGTTGDMTSTQVDLTCYSDDDCCIRSSLCQAVAVLYSKVQGLVYWPPAKFTSCSRCYTPVVEVSCRNNQCTGEVINSNGYDGIPGVESHCGKIQGTGGTTSQSSAVDADSPAQPAHTSPPQIVFGC